MYAVDPEGIAPVAKSVKGPLTVVPSVVGVVNAAVGPGIKFATVMEDPETVEVRPLAPVADQEIVKIVL